MPLVSFSKMEASVRILRMTSRDWDYANPAVLLAGGDSREHLYRDSPDCALQVW